MTDIALRYWSVKRSDYQEVLHEAALEAGCELRLGQKVAGIDEDAPGVELQSGDVVRGDLVVIADGDIAPNSNLHRTKLTGSILGIKSALRQLILPSQDVSAISHPLSTYRAWAPLEALNSDPNVASLLKQPATNIWLGPARHMITYPASNNTILAINGTYPSRNDSAGEWNHAASVAEIQQRFHDFDPIAKAILAHARDCKAWALAEVPRLPRWRSQSGRVVLLGDAAHGMLQFLAQGAAMATEDAGALAESFAGVKGREEVPRAMWIYERSRRWRCERVQAQARRNGDFIHMFDGEEQECRDRKLKGEAREADWEVDCGPLMDPAFTQWLYGHDTIQHVRKVRAAAEV